MRIVAIAALHHAFIDAMLRRHFKLGALRRVTRITEFGLWLGEKGSGGRRLVNGMTVGADYIGLGMRRPPDIGARNIFRMAGEARFEDRCGTEYGKGLDGRLPAMSIHVFAGRAVASLALLLSVWVFIEVQQNVRVARPARLVANEPVLGRWRRLCLQQKGQKQNKNPFHSGP